MSKKISYHFRKKIFQISKYLAFWAALICFTVWSVLFVSKNQYVGKITKLHSVVGTCSNAYYKTVDNIPLGKSVNLTDTIIVVEIDGEEFVISETTRKRQIEKYIPDNMNFLDECIGETLDITYTVKGDTYHIQSLAIPKKEIVFIELDKVRAENISALIVLLFFYGIAIIFFGILCIGSCIQTLKTPPTFKQLRKWHKKRKIREQAKKKN